MTRLSLVVLTLGALAIAGCTPGSVDEPEQVATVSGPMTPFPDGLGDDSCAYAANLECDDVRFGGTGMCETGTDATDCEALAAGGTNSCRQRFDGVCDEPTIGMGICASGTDTADCAPMAIRRSRTNDCVSALNGICEEREFGGNGICAPRTDTIDCLGRTTVLGMRDYYSGYDDRVRVDSGELPWRAIGILGLRVGRSCTATLVAPDIVLTAAHCLVTEDRRVVREGAFLAGFTRDGPSATARISDIYVNPEFLEDRGGPGPGRGDGRDWAFVRLSQPIGDTQGYLPVLALSPDQQRLIEQRQGYAISQAGYSWDTGEDISAHLDCTVDTFFDTGSLRHNCDITLGDSGSPLLADLGGGNYAVIGVSSSLAQLPGDPASSQFAVDAGSFADQLNAFVADRLR